MGYMLLPMGVWSGRLLGLPRALQGHTRLHYPTLGQPMALQGHPRREKRYLEWVICYLQWGKCYLEWGICYCLGVCGQGDF